MTINWRSLSDEEYLDNAERQIWLSAFAANNPRAPAHRETDAAYDEAKARKKPWLYNRAWNAAWLSSGNALSDDQILSAREPEQTAPER